MLKLYKETLLGSYNSFFSENTLEKIVEIRGKSTLKKLREKISSFWHSPIQDLNFV